MRMVLPRWSVMPLTLLVACCFVRAAGRIDFEQENLPNGLRVIYAPLRQAPVVHVRVVYHVGSKDERPDRQGFAHMFEHMMFRGSAHVKPEQHMRLIQTVGGSSNAFTSFDQTVYFQTLPSNQLELALWLEADRMASFRVSEEIYMTERRVVNEEYGRRQNQPYGTMMEEFLKLVFTKHSYRWTPIGNMEHLRAAPVEELQDFFNTYYVPNNATLVIAGDIDVPAARAMVNRFFAWIPRGADGARSIPAEPPQNQPRRAEIVEPVPQHAMLMGFRIPPYRSDDQYALAVLGAVLSAGNSARLDQRLVTGPSPLCAAVSAGPMALEDGGVFLVRATVLRGKDPAQVQQIIEEELLAIRQRLVAEEELQRAQMIHRVGEITSRQTAENIASQLGQEAVFGGDPHRVNTDMQRILAVTAEDVRKVARRHLRPEGVTVLHVRPGEPTATPATGPAEAVAPSTRPVQPRAVSFPEDYPRTPPLNTTTIQPKFQKGRESEINGVKVIVLTDQRLPLVSWSLTVRQGSHAVPARKEGLAGLTAKLMERGAGDLDYAALSRDLESRGISIEVSDGGDYSRISASALTEQVEHGIGRTRQILLEPRFDAAEFARLKEQRINELQRALENPETVAGLELDAALFGDSPLGRYATPRTVAAVTLEDVKAYYASIFRPQGAILTISGDVTLERGRQLAQRLLAGWEPGDLPKVQYPPIPQPTGRRIILVDRPEGRQSLIRMAVPAYDIHNDIKFAGAVAERILSGGIDSRLGRYVRAEKGYAYSVWGMFGPRRQAGRFMAGTETSFATTADAIEAMFKVFGDMRRQNVTEEEMTQTRLRVAGGMVMGMQTIQQQAGYRVDGMLNGYPIDYYDTYPQRIAGVTAEDVRKVMDQYVRDDRMTIVVVAPAGAVKTQLQRLGEVEVVPMPLRRKPSAPPVGGI